MVMRAVLCGVGVVVASVAGGCATSGGGASADASEAAVVEDAVLHRDGRFVLAGQLSEAQLRSLGGEGVGVVVNTRTAGEVEGLPFDEAAAVRGAGVEYVEIPLGGDAGYGPEDVEAFAAAVRGSEGDVVIHCGSGTRARNLYAAYLVRYEGVSVKDATARMARLGQGPSALERLLDEDLTVTRE